MGSVDAYEKLNRIGEGTYGIVYRAKHRQSGSIVALKRIRMDNIDEGFPLSSLREISILRNLCHVNVVKVLDVVVGSKIQDVFLLMEYCEQDMAKLMDTAIARHDLSRVFQPSQVKCLMNQLLAGVAYLHDSFIIHRDIKLSNLLLTNQGILKLADFGLARQFGDPIVQMTPGVVTLWYRPPEILFGMEKYTVAVDMWAIGCVFGELLKSQILLPGDTTTKQLILISELLGTPNSRIWPEMQDLPLYDTFNLPFYEFDTLSHKFSDFGSNTCDLIKSFLIYRPQNRISASQALKHGYFREHPKACPPNRLPTLEKFENSRYRRD